MIWLFNPVWSIQRWFYRESNGWWVQWLYMKHEIEQARDWEYEQLRRCFRPV